MKAGARLSIVDQRSAARHPIDFTTRAEHRRLGEFTLNLVNISAQGFMIRGVPVMEKGERIELRLPIIGRIEGHLVWSHEGRAGFQFERPLRANHFAEMLAKLQAQKRLQKGRP